jgi:hypothetical protein
MLDEEATGWTAEVMWQPYGRCTARVIDCREDGETGRTIHKLAYAGEAQCQWQFLDDWEIKWIAPPPGARLRDVVLNQPCMTCGIAEETEADAILLCDGEGCENCQHLQCVKPQLARVPEGSWFRAACVAPNGAPGESGAMDIDHGSDSDDEVLRAPRKAK